FSFSIRAWICSSASYTTRWATDFLPWYMTQLMNLERTRSLNRGSGLSCSSDLVHLPAMKCLLGAMPTPVIRGWALVHRNPLSREGVRLRLLPLKNLKFEI